MSEFRVRKAGIVIIVSDEVHRQEQHADEVPDHHQLAIEREGDGVSCNMLMAAGCLTILLFYVGYFRFFSHNLGLDYGMLAIETFGERNAQTGGLQVGVLQRAKWA